MSIMSEFESRKLVAVCTISDVKDAVPTAEALLKGGISAIELTLRTPAGLDCIKAIRKALPEIYIGAGTVLTPEQAEQAKQAGACFGVAPGTNVRVLAKANQIGLPFGPGIFTPSDIEVALENGCRMLKYFPAATCGIKHLKAMAAPYKHLGIKFLPLGGVNINNLAEMLSDPLIAAVGGSWLAKPEQIQQGLFDVIEAQAREASEVLKSLSK